MTTGMFQGTTTEIDALGNFPGDIATAAKDAVFTGCQDAIAMSEYLAPAADHFLRLHLTGPLTLGFLYDTELNFGDDDDPPTKSGKPGPPGTKTMVAKAIADYGPDMPTDFTGKTWEESRWLGLLLKERAIAMSNNRTWRKDMDQLGTWEAARRLHTASSNNPESGTDLSMDYDITSAYKAAAPTPTPCWGAPPLLDNTDTMSSVYTLGLNKSASATDKSTWKITTSMGSGYLPCPANPTP